MKTFVAILAGLALASPITCQSTCTVDDVITSMATINKYVSEMQSDVDATADNIDPSGSIYQNFKSIVNHLTGDITCNITVKPRPEDETRICGAFSGDFGPSQLHYLHIADGLQFYRKNKDGQNGVKMHGYVVQYQSALKDYVDRIKQLVPSCSSQIDTAYQPLDKQLDSLLQDYPNSS